MRLLSHLIALLSDSALVLKFVLGRGGSGYGIGRIRKLLLARRIHANAHRVPSLTTWRQHLMLVDAIFRVPPTTTGDVVECGCYNGASTINLSIACAMAGRRLLVCDSFEGLPAPVNDERAVLHASAGGYYVWERGQFQAEGGIDGVKRNVTRWGAIEACELVKGFYAESLPRLAPGPIVLIFEDVDLASSVSDCIRHLWPRLQEGCSFFCHEPWSVPVVALFYDREWWRGELGCDPPGFYGSGKGTLAGLIYSNMGYAIKVNAGRVLADGESIRHQGS